MPPSNDDYFIALAHSLADVAAIHTLKRFRAAGVVYDKSQDNPSEQAEFDPVTFAECDAEEAMRALILEHAPSHGIYGEEGGSYNLDADYIWYLDPVDGTRSFIAGQPLWGTLIGLRHGAKVLLGMMDQPYIGERVFAAAGEAQWQSHMRETESKQQALATSRCARLADAIIATTTPELFADDNAAACWQTIVTQARLVRYGGDCYNYALLAAGHIDAVIEQQLAPYDICALIPIIEAAGGRITDWHGTPINLTDNKSLQVLACGDAQLHQTILPQLASAAHP